MNKFKVALGSTVVLAGIGLAAAPLSAAASSPGAASPVPRVTVPAVPAPTGRPITPGVPAKPGKPGTVRALAVEADAATVEAVDAGGVDAGGGTLQPAPSQCSDPVFGGNFLCGGYYGPTGATFFDFRDGTRLILVIGTNHQVYTRSTIANSTKLTAWKSLGGSMDGRLGISAQSMNGAFRFDVHGTDGRWWSRARDVDGTWTGWSSRP
ncbi:hypothetical protein [Kitasatospora sp. NPDC089509]|uniref:hypothetical protein n=1 Tax=Kitasatospora sp. NPDC089509 TaxID=3364079 RepID=UPI0038155C58